MRNSKLQLKLIILTVLFLAFPAVSGAETLNQEVVFTIDPYYDEQGRREITALLQKITSQLYVYVDKDWWDDLTYGERSSLNLSVSNLTAEFERKIYPVMTNIFGSEPKLDFGSNEKITILIHPMIADAGGYFNSGDVYEKLQNPLSNERVMVYLNSQHVGKEAAKSFLAHEFTHLITVNQKDLLRKVTEEVWLNEARAEYSATILGYDDVYQGSNLERRVKDFLNRPTVSLAEWLNRKEDYGAVNLFAQYLVDHYGRRVLVDSLQSNRTGIESINLALTDNGYNENFSQIFSDWAIALLINDCSLGERYCYLNEHLKNFRITPAIYYLPRTNTVLSTYHNLTYWAPNWHRLIGGGNKFVLELDGPRADFHVTYLLCGLVNNCSVEFFQGDEIVIDNFSSQYSSLTIISFIAGKTADFNGLQRSFSFSWIASVEDKTDQEREAELIASLQAQIEELRRQIADYQMRINAILGTSVSCQRFDIDLHFGMTNSAQVRCLQEFLRDQGTDIYPEGLVTGNFLSLTQLAVMRFQERHASEILSPLGLQQGTGYVGAATRTKINSLINQ